MINQYKIQSNDTSFDMELLQFKLWSGLNKKEKLNLVQKTAKKGIKLAIMGIKNQFPFASNQEIKQFYLQKRYPYYHKLNFPYLQSWAKRLNLLKEIQQAFTQSGITM